MANALLPLFALQGQLADLSANVMNTYDSFTRLTGVTAQLTYSIPWDAMIRKYQAANPGIVFQRLPIKSANFNASVNPVLTGAGGSIPTILGFSIPGMSGSGANFFPTGVGTIDPLSSSTPARISARSTCLSGRASEANRHVAFPEDGGLSGGIFFSNTSTAGDMVNLATVGGNFVFLDTSSAGSATFDITSAQQQASIIFEDDSTAGSATINASAGSVILFYDTSTAGNATLNLTSEAFVLFEGSNKAEHMNGNCLRRKLILWFRDRVRRPLGCW